MNRLKKHLALGCMLLCGVWTQAQTSLWTEIGVPGLTEEQQRYFDIIRQDDRHSGFRFVSINPEALSEQILSVDFGFGVAAELLTRFESDTYGTRQRDGDVRFQGNEEGKFLLVCHNDFLTGHFTFQDRIFRLKPLGEGLHILFEADASMPEGDQCREPEVPEEIKERIEGKTEKEATTGAKASDECRWRVLVGFTPAARAEEASILSEIMIAIGLANQAFATAEIGLRVELAHAYEVDYDEFDKSGNKILSDWSFSFWPYNVMQEVHDLRDFHNADNCALIIAPSAEVAGVAWLNLSYSLQFSVTRSSNISLFTFHHELGHNALCTHDLENDIEPGTAPYAGHNQPLGCFSTIMSYGACADSVLGDCPRMNIFSRGAQQTLPIPCDDQTLNIFIGNAENRNRDRLALSASSLLTMETNPNSITLLQQQELNAQEASHFVAKNEFTHVSFFPFILNSGSAGSFRAGNEVTLNDGFHAKPGSEFTASVGYCPPIDDSGDIGAPVASLDVDPDQVLNAPKDDNLFELDAFPNPFSGELNLRIRSDTDVEKDAVLTLTDLTGRTVSQKQIIVSPRSEITFLREDFSEAAPGVYLLSVGKGANNTAIKVVQH